MVSVNSTDPNAAPGLVVRKAKTTFGNRTPNQTTRRGPCRDLLLRLGICATTPSNAPLRAGQVQLKCGEEERSPVPDLTNVRSQKIPTLHVNKIPNAAAPNRRSVTWEGRTSWEDRYIDHIDTAREFELSGTVLHTHTHTPHITHTHHTQIHKQSTLHTP